MNLRSLLGIRATYAPFLAAVASLLIGHHGSWAQISFSVAPGSPLTVGGQPTTPVIIDFNKDGWTDIVVALESDHAIAVLLGRPQGGFQPAPGSPFPAGNSPTALAVAELDGDANLDVVAVNSSNNSLTLLRGDGRGGLLRLENPIPTGIDPRIVRIGDVDGDSRMDLLVANRGSHSISVLLSQGNGTFYPASDSPITAAAGPWGLATADFNNDGRADFVTTSSLPESHFSILLNQGAGHFMATTHRIPSLRPENGGLFEFVAADLDRDGRMDLVSTTGGSFPLIIVMKGDGTGKFQTQPLRNLNNRFFNGPGHLLTADLTADGFPEIAFVNGEFSGLWSSALKIAQNNGHGGFDGSIQHVESSHEQFRSVAAGDLNRDGALDLVICRAGTGLSLLLNTALPPALEVVTGPSAESQLAARIRLRRTGSLDQRISFVLATVDDTAKSGREYIAVRTRIVFEPGQRDQVVEIPLINDDLGTHQGRRFLVEFSEGEGIVGLPWAVPVEVRDDDELVTVRAEVGGPGLLYHPSSGEPIFPEGAGPIRFTARRYGSLNSARQFQVRYRVEGRDRTPDAIGFGATAAIPERDYIMTATEGVFQFGPGVTEQSVEVALPDDTVPRGNLGIAFRLIYEDIVNQGGDEAIAFILDDERSLLRQEVAVEPYLPAHFGDQSNLTIFGLADGEALVIRDIDTVLRLTREGVPDLTFGRGTGRALLPWKLHPESWDTLRLDRELPDGRLQLKSWSSDALVRLTSDGIPDVSFGSGTGQLTVLGSLQDTMPDGGLLLVSEDGRHLKRLLPDGLVDPSFSTAWAAKSGFDWARVSPQGRIWALVDNQLRLFHGSGEPVLEFIPRPGVYLFNLPALPEVNRAHFDSEGRAYFANGDPDAFGDPTQGIIIRFLADGTYDASYRPVPRGVSARLAELNSDGTALAILDRNHLVELDAFGRSRSLYHDATRHIGGARRRVDDTVLLAFPRFAGPGGGLGPTLNDLGVLTPDGQLILIEGTADAATSDNGSIPWVAATEGLKSPGVRLFRSTLRLDQKMVGSAHSGRYALESTASVVLQRSGSTENVAIVLGRIFPLVAGKWDSLLAQSFEVEFPVSQADVELALPQLAQPGRQPLREYLVQLESATGVELSEFTACRLWVLDDEALPSPGELSLERFAGDDEQNSALLLGRWESRNPQGLEFRARLDLPWEGWEIGESPGFSMLDPFWLRPVPTDDTTSGFFRMRTP